MAGKVAVHSEEANAVVLLNEYAIQKKLLVLHLLVNNLAIVYNVFSSFLFVCFLLVTHHPAPKLVHGDLFLLSLRLTCFQLAFLS